MLTDREKAIISYIIISKQQKLSQENIEELNINYLRCLDIDVVDLSVAIAKEYDQVRVVIINAVNGKEINFDGAFSSLDNREKFILYELCFSVEKIPMEIHYLLTESMRTLLLGNYDTKPLLNEVTKQIHEVIRFIKYMKKINKV